MKPEKYESFINDANAKPDIKAGIIEVIATAVLIIGAIIIQHHWGDQCWAIIIVPILSTVASIVGVAAVWEFFSKLKFATLVVKLANISANLQISGIVKYTNNFKDIYWREELKYTKYLKVVITYARTWREQNREVLADFIKRGGIVEIALPNYNNKDLMDEYDRRFSFVSGETCKRVAEAKKEFESLGAQITLCDRAFLNSYYFMDAYAIMAPFNHLKEKGYVPAIKAEKHGALYEYISKEIDAIFSSGKERGDEKQD